MNIKVKIMPIVWVIATLLLAFLLVYPIGWGRVLLDGSAQSVCSRLTEVARDNTKRSHLVRWVDEVTSEPDLSVWKTINSELLPEQQQMAFGKMGFDQDIFNTDSDSLPVMDRWRIETVPNSYTWKDNGSPFKIDFVQFAVARDFIVVSVGNKAVQLGQNQGRFTEIGGLKYKVTFVDDRVAVYCD